MYRLCLLSSLKFRINSFILLEEGCKAAHQILSEDLAHIVVFHEFQPFFHLLAPHIIECLLGPNHSYWAFTRNSQSSFFNLDCHGLNCGKVSRNQT